MAVDGLTFWLGILEREPTAATTDVDPEEVKQPDELHVMLQCSL